MSFPRYPKYKDSGVEWLGEVPEHWEVVRGRRLFAQKREPALGQDEQLSATQKYGVVPQKVFMELEDQKVALALSGTNNFKHVEKDDFVISLRSFQGGIERSMYSGCVSPAYTVLRPTQPIVPAFWAYLLKSTGYVESLQTMTDGIRDGKAISYQQFGQIGLPLPSLEEQMAVASILDRETAKIDALIAEQQRLIELLQEKRQAVISHAVTKGLNPDAPMKDSGIEWLGEVPEHWNVAPLKQIVSVPITDGPHETPAFLDEGVPFVSAEAVSSGRIDFAKVRGCISEEDNARYSLKYAPQRYDIYMVKSGATTGVTAIVEDRTDFNIWSPLAAIRCGKAATPYFVFNFIRSRNFQEAVTLNWSYGTQQNIGMGVIENLPCVLPPISEQHAIVAFLNRFDDAATPLVCDAERAITLLQERRSALISAAVTGQIDVRGLANSEAA